MNFRKNHDSLLKSLVRFLNEPTCFAVQKLNPTLDNHNLCLGLSANNGCMNRSSIKMLRMSFLFL